MARWESFFEELLGEGCAAAANGKYLYAFILAVTHGILEGDTAVGGSIRDMNDHVFFI